MQLCEDVCEKLGLMGQQEGKPMEGVKEETDMADIWRSQTLLQHCVWTREGEGRDEDGGGGWMGYMEGLKVRIP